MKIFLMMQVGAAGEVHEKRQFTKMMYLDRPARYMKNRIPQYDIPRAAGRHDETLKQTNHLPS
ncbi:hypothetical protein FZC84_17250 [Rossellomorea vietnamensis]|uniref:Uncharacterized protein n=1 Tax=Rossellomorea vietnamensis TaxID=218284 RepID=A0A5D4MAC5_9BACI|nr:hypothetical protein [Rossellomorea vietnamensis]TYR97945.1 hypothetical protein FZC84_17250 [Rossellomorea vietnamensis]